METSESLGTMRLLRFRLGILPHPLTVYHILLIRKSSHFTQEKLFQAFSHDHYILPRLVVDVAVCEHLVEVCNRLIVSELDRIRKKVLRLC